MGVVKIAVAVIVLELPIALVVVKVKGFVAERITADCIVIDIAVVVVGVVKIAVNVFPNPLISKLVINCFSVGVGKIQLSFLQDLVLFMQTCFQSVRIMVRIMFVAAVSETFISSS